MERKIISFMNMKGGVGKTTVCVNIAHCLSEYKKKKVLVIDLDPQSNTSQYLLSTSQYKTLLDEEKTIFDIYKYNFQKSNYSSIEDDTEEEKEKNIIFEISENLHLIPGDLQMVRLSQGVSSTAIMYLDNFLKKNQTEEKYDYIFIDCPPTQSIYTESALAISDYYLLPVKPDFLSSLGIDLVKNIIRTYQRTVGKKIKCAGIVFNLVHNQDYEKETMVKIKENNINDVYEEYIKYSSRISEGSEKQKYLLDIRRYKGTIKKITDNFVKKVGGES